LPEYPSAHFIIKSGNTLEDHELATALFNEASSVLTKQNIPFRIEVKSGSIDFSIQVLLDMLEQVSQNPTVAAAVGGAVGGITTRILDRKRSIKKLKFNAAWKNLLKLQKTINRNLTKKIISISRVGDKLNVKFREGDRVSSRQIKLLFTSGSEREKELKRRIAELEKELLGKQEWPGLEQRLAERVDEISTQDLIVVALRLKPNQRKEDLKMVLSDWGKVFGTWFEGGNFSGRLLKKGIVMKEGSGEEGDIFRLTRKGELEADRLIAALHAKPDEKRKG
jgi:hypothetical protein